MLLKNFFNTIIRTTGIIIFFLLIFTVIALISVNKADPSIFHAGNSQVTNLGGAIGANIADIILQSIGYTYLYHILFFFIVGFRMIKGYIPGYFLLRASLLLFITPVLCGAIYMSGKHLGFNGLQIAGFIGDYIVIELTHKFPQQLVFYALSAAASIGVLLSLGLRLREWKNILLLFISAFILISKLFAKIFLIMFSKLKHNEAVTDITTQARKKAPRAEVIQKFTNFTEPLPLLEAQESEQYDEPVVFHIDQNKFILPSPNLLKPLQIGNKSNINKDQLERNGTDLLNVLKDFGITAELLNISTGPVVTLYEIEPSAGTKSSRIIGLADDIARSMRALSTRIAVIPGKNAIGIELPNQKRDTVYLREMLESQSYKDNPMSLPMILGKNISGVPVIADLAKMPHLLVAGTTGSGKSVAINTMILSLLYRHTPETCKFVMIDPKMLELSVYDGIPHLLSPVVTDPKKAVIALKWVVKEMEERYRAMSTLGVRNIAGYNKAVSEASAIGKTLTKTVQTGFDRSTGKPIFEKITMESSELPFIVVIVDEMADLMLVAGKDIEMYIQRLAQMARAAGIHIIMATQRPSVDVITGVIKANFPTRISFQVTSRIDSRTVLGEQGAEQLLGMGDMLYMMPGGKIERVHGPFVDDKEVENIVQFWKTQGQPDYVDDITASEDDESNFSMEDGGDDLYRQAVEIVLKDRKASTSYIQRCLRIGYNRAAILIEKMEKEGVVSAPNHSGKREILQ